MNALRQGEIAERELVRNLCEMPPNLRQASGVLRVVGDHFNRAAVRAQAKMVGSFEMGEAHRLVAPLIDRSVMLVAPLLRSFRLRVGGRIWLLRERAHRDLVLTSQSDYTSLL